MCGLGSCARHRPRESLNGTIYLGCQVIPWLKKESAVCIKHGADALGRKNSYLGERIGAGVIMGRLRVAFRLGCCCLLTGCRCCRRTTGLARGWGAGRAAAVGFVVAGRTLVLGCTLAVGAGFDDGAVLIPPAGAALLITSVRVIVTDLTVSPRLPNKGRASPSR